MPFISNQNKAHEILYQITQYRGIVKATIATSVISMISSALIATAYIFLRHKHPDKANRVSLRCVFLASCMNMIDSIFELSSMLTTGDTAFCRSSAIITMFTGVMSSTFLCLVGINLILVFVINIKSSTASRMELVYYIGAVLYGFISISVPISEEVQSALDPESQLACFHYIYYYQIFGHSSLLWMWYYGFLFLTTLIAVLCSIAASIKLLHEHHSLMSRFTDIANLSETAEASETQIQLRINDQSNIFRKVVTRCALYPLVPFISNIWGFIAQLILVSGKTPSFSLSMFESVFGSLQGFFVAIIFFSDPTMTEFTRQTIKTWKNKKSEDSRKKRPFDFAREEVVPSANNSITNMLNTKDDDLQVKSDNIFLQTPPKSYTKESRRASTTNSIHSFELFCLDKNSRGSYYDDSATMVAPMYRSDVSYSTPVSDHSRNCSGDINLGSSPCSTHGGSTLAFSDCQASSNN